IMGLMGLPLMTDITYIAVFIYYAGLMFSLGITLLLVNTPMQVMLQKEIDEEYKGRVFSILETMAMALAPLGMVLYGFLFDVLPAQWIMLSSAAMLIGVVLVLVRSSVLRKVHPQLNREKVVYQEGTIMK